MRWILDPHFISIRREHHHLSVRALFAILTEQAGAVHDVGEGVIILRHGLRNVTAGLEREVQVNNRSHRLDHGSRAERLARDHAHAHQPVLRPRGRDARRLYLLITRLHHFILLW